MRWGLDWDIFEGNWFAFALFECLGLTETQGRYQLSLIRPLWLSPMATGRYPHLSTDLLGLHTPSTETNHLHRCLPSTALLKQHFHSHSLWSLVFAPANIYKHFPCIPVIFLCMTLDCLKTVDSLPPALVILLSGTLFCCLPWLLPGIVSVSVLPLIHLPLSFYHCLFDPDQYY